MATISTRKRESMRAQRFAFPKERKEPLNDASHVRNAIARFNQVEGVSETERAAAWRGLAGSRQEDVELDQQGWVHCDEGRERGRHTVIGHSD